MNFERRLLAGVTACALSGCATLDMDTTTTASIKPATARHQVAAKATQPKSFAAADDQMTEEEAQIDACQKWRIAWQANPDNHHGMTPEQWKRKGQVCVDSANNTNGKP